MFITFAFAAAVVAGPAFAAPASDAAYPTISYGDGILAEAAWPTVEAGGTIVVEPGATVHYAFLPQSTARLWKQIDDRKAAHPGIDWPAVEIYCDHQGVNHRWTTPADLLPEEHPGRGAG